MKASASRPLVEFWPMGTREFYAQIFHWNSTAP